jgi:hypothetical protein
MHFILFRVCSPEPAVEDIIGREMHQPRIVLSARERQIPHRQRIRFVSGDWLPLRNVHHVVGGGVEYSERIQFCNRLLDQFAIRDIELRPPERANPITPASQLRAQLNPKLTVRPEYRDSLFQSEILSTAEESPGQCQLFCGIVPFTDRGCRSSNAGTVTGSGG